MLCRHTLRPADAVAGLSRIFPDLDASTLASVLALARTSYPTAEEREAERFARLVGAAIRGHRAPGAGGEDAGALERARRMLEQHNR